MPPTAPLAWLQPFLPYIAALGAVCGIVAFLWRIIAAVARTVLEIRDALLEMNRKIGQKYPNPEGLLGDVAQVQDKLEKVETQQAEQHTKLSVIEANVANRRATDRDPRNGS